MKKLLPIGIQTLSDIINENYIYVDKTEIIYKLISEGRYYFLSRPRRFGKSLTVSTLYEIFNGNKELFKDLWIYNSNWKWIQYPIIKLDFGEVKESEENVESEIERIIKNNSEKNEIELNGNNITAKFSNLIKDLYKKYNQKVVILVDEYDKIIVNNLTNSELAEKNRNHLRYLFSSIKPNDEYIKFCFLTGVSKFAKTSIFSTLNNIMDISLNYKYSILCGLTENEILNNYDEYINECAIKHKKNKNKLIEEIRKWYNGYCFSDNFNPLKVYNPFSIINFFSNFSFKNYWINSGNTKFLFDFFKLNNYENLDFENITLNMGDLDKTEIESIKLEALLFQTGYLTIESYSHENLKFKLKIPNFEIKYSFFNDLILYIYKNKNDIYFDFLIKIKNLLEKCKFEELFENLKIYFAGFQYDIKIDRESYYQSLLYALFDLASIRAKTEENTNNGRIDLIIESEKHFCIIELKLNKTAEEAINQVENRKYYQKYLKYKKDIYIFGINFNSEINNIDQYLVKKIKN